MRTTAWMVLVLALAACSRTVAYRPRVDALSGLQAPERHRRFAEALSRASKPRIGNVNVDDAHYAFAYELVLHGPWGIPVGRVNDADVGIYFANIERVDLYSNNAVWIVGANGRVVQRVRFASRQDAERFVDALEAMRQRRDDAVAVNPAAPAIPPEATIETAPTDTGAGTGRIW